jgi:histidinol-phosphate aminotransferase
MAITPKKGLDTINYYMVGISSLPGFDRPIKLSSNESALGMSPLSIEAARQAASMAHLYPEVDTDRLAVVLSDQFNLHPERMLFGPGSDELLQRIVNTFAGPGQELIHSRNAYMQFPIYAKLAGATPVAAPDRDFHYDADAILGCVNENTRIVLLANPDNPSGTYLAADEIRKIHSGLPENVLLIIDAAYEEFAAADDYESGTRLVHEFNNVLVTRTFSKVYGMAGLRLGWGYGPAWIADLLTRIGPSFPVNSIANAAGIAAVKDTDHMQKVLSHNTTWIERFSKNLGNLGLKVYPSQTNFVLVGFPPEIGKTAANVNQHLNENGIIPRQFAVEEFEDKLRFTIGLDWEMEKTILVLENYLGA